MSHLIDSEKLIAEIERRITETEELGELGRANELLMLETFITSLQQEQPEVDLEKEIEKYYYDRFAFISSVHNPTLVILTDIAKHFYELGLKARKEE